MDDIRARFDRVLWREHALDRLFERSIHPDWVREAIFSADAEIIEDYPGHHYGPASLVLGWWDDRQPLHMLIGLGDPLCIVTVYDPRSDPRNRWAAPDFRTRRANLEA